MSGWIIDIVRDDITRASLRSLELPALEDGQIAVRIDSTGLTSNNVTYGVFGQNMPDFGAGGGYWDFFGDRDEPGHLPMWGFATVTESRSEGIKPGDLYYGYYPLASDTILTVGAEGKRGFTDVTPRRAALPGLYNNYKLVSQLPDYRPQDHDLWPIYRGLFFTAWLMMDQADEEHDFGGEQVLVTSASSKTAISYAHLHTLRAAPKARLVGVTSGGNVNFVRSLGLYDEVIAYDEIEQLNSATPTALIDVAGNRGVVAQVHRHFTDKLTASIAVGFSHWDADRTSGDLPGVKPEQFFVAGRSKKRAMEWGGARLAETIATAWLSFMDTATDLIEIDRRQGGEQALEAYLDAVSGRANPRGGVIIERGA